MGYLFSILVNAGILKKLFRDYLFFDLTIVCLAVISFVLILNIFLGKRKIRNIFDEYIVLIIGSFTIFIISVLLSGIYTESPLFWKEKLIRIIILNVPSFIIPCCFLNLFDIKKFVRGSIIIYIIIIISYFFIVKKYGIQVFYRTHELDLPNYLTWGSTIAFNTLLLIGILLDKKRTIVIDASIILVALSCMLMIYIAGARGPFIIFMLSFLVVILLRKEFKLLAFCFGSILILIVSLSLISGYNSKHIKFGRSERIINMNIKSKSIQKRLEWFEESWNLTKEKVLLGYGIGSFSYVTSGEDRRGYPHNIFLEIWFENGLLAVSMFIAFLFLIIYLGFFRIHKPYVSTLLGINLYFVLSLMKSSSLTDARVFFTFAGMLAATSYITKSSKVQIYS